MTRTGTHQEFRRIVWGYYDRHGRHELPWRLNLDPYAILVSEVMLQQTQVERVIPKYTKWLEEFPTGEHLARAPLPAVLTRWQGLGYNRRALALQRCAQTVVATYHGQLPRMSEQLIALPGIGPSTAAAIQAFAFNRPVVMVETNIRTVYLHHYFSDRENISDQELIPLIQETLVRKRARQWYWALMDYGSFLKKQHSNPARRSRHYMRQSRFQGSNRQVRGAIVRALTKTPALSEQALSQQLQTSEITPARVALATEQLTREGFITHDTQQKKIFLKSTLIATGSE